MSTEPTTQAKTYKVTGENILTGNTWDCATGLTAPEAVETAAGWRRLESDYKVVYYTEEETAS